MDIEKIKENIRKIIKEYLEGKRNKESTVDQALEIINLIEVLDSRDELLINGYYALKYLTDEYETSMSELIYLDDCFSGKKVFSEKERDKFIGENQPSLG